jgi:hypothetical protein
VRFVREHELASIETHGPFDLLIIQELPKDTYMPGAQFSFEYRDCVQPASLQRIPRRYLHQLPGNIALRMVESSLQAVLRRVDGIACAMGDPRRSYMLPEGLKDQKRREDIMTLHLLRAIDRMTQPLATVQQPSGLNRNQSRKTSIWDQGTVPRNGGRG